jgi:adenosine deaminase
VADTWVHTQIDTIHGPADQPRSPLITAHVIPAPKNILLCTLGASWAVVAEIFGWLAPQHLDLYAHHPARAQLDALRLQHQLAAPDELWICSTEGPQTQASLAYLRQWWQRLGAPLPLRVWTAAGTDQLASQAECDHMQELTLRLVLLASDHTAAGGQLLLSLAGGRKTMSAGLQGAGAIFGAQAWLHVVSPEPSPAPLFARSAADRDAQPSLFAVPLAAELAQSLTPLVAGSGTRNELLDIELDGRTVSTQAFPLPLVDPGAHCVWAMPANATRARSADNLQSELRRRQRQSSQLLGNFMAQLAQSEHHDNWRSLYRLSPAAIKTLRTTSLKPGHLQWLTALPKADLHRHVGGCLSLADQRTVAHAIWQDIGYKKQLQALSVLNSLLQIHEWPWHWPEQLAGPDRPLLAACLLLHASDAQLQHNLFDVTAPRIALKQHALGFAAYERPGELSGSALLGHPAALAPYARALVAQAVSEGLVYLELRGSPHKYRPHDPAGFLADFDRALTAAGASTSPATAPGAAAGLRIGFVWILDRRQRQTLATVVAQAVAARHTVPHFVLGLDLAGDEGTHNPAALASGFAPAFEACLPITIHAGEGESAENIWQAAYHLHADRIGHGLSLIEDAALASRFRDRGICLELCPSSNREVVGFKDPAHPATSSQPTYPLRRFIDSGLPVTLCTDNPGISRTTMAAEYLCAARMTEGGLSQWESLALMRQAFVHAFLPSAEREVLIKHADQAIFALLAQPVTEHRPTHITTLQGH